MAKLDNLNSTSGSHLQKTELNWQKEGRKHSIGYVGSRLRAGTDCKGFSSKYQKQSLCL